jgi:hypothetical protein
LAVLSQESFTRVAAALERDVSEFGAFDKLEQVLEASAAALALGARMKDAEEAVALFNSREGLFNREVTEYEALDRGAAISHTPESVVVRAMVVGEVDGGGWWWWWWWVRWMGSVGWWSW